jgi:UDP-arabinose 4-epimerase
MVLVTGGAGFIGSHTCKALSRSGISPVSFDDLSTGFRHNVAWGPLVVGNVADPVALRKVFRQYDIEGVMHFAACAYVGESVRDPIKYYRNNLGSLITLLEVIEEFDRPPLIFSSSCATYGVPASIPIPAGHPQRPVNPYGWSKLMGEQIILDACHAHGLRAGILRYFNAAGADPEGELREEHSPETHLIPLAIDAALGTAPPLRIFGSDYETPDGTCIRDYIHVTDLAEAHVTALRELLNGEPTFIRNLGTGNGHSVKDVMATVSAVTGTAVPHEFCERREGDPPALAAAVDAKTAATLKYSTLPTIVETAVRSRRRCA